MKSTYLLDFILPKEVVKRLRGICFIRKKVARDKRELAEYSTVTSSLKEGNSVALVGFGTFSVKERAARTGRNPQTGAEIQISAATIPSFKPGKGLKDQVNP